MRECQEEGIDTTDVKFVDNKECLDLLLSKGGIFSMLDDECMVNGTEKNFLQKVNVSFLGSKTKPAHPFYGQTTGKAMDNNFRIKHYAAEVQYCTDGILDKNRDTLKAGMKAALRLTRLRLMQVIMPPASDDTAKTKLTVGGYFRSQLKDLMDLINSTNPHWIRCIKPHPAKQPRMFSHSEVMSQLRSAGVLDTVKVRKAGYPIRFKLDLFLLRYRILVTKDMVSNGRGDQSSISRQIFDNLGITNDIGQLGKTKVFLRHAAFMKLNHAKDEATSVFALLLQSVGRACKDRALLFKQYLIRHREKIMEERRKREEALRKQREEEARRRKAEEEEAARQARARLEKRIRSVVVIQRIVRGILARVGFVRRYVEDSRAKEEKRLDDGFQRFRLNFDDLDRRVKIIEKKQLEAETSKVIATQKTQESRRKALGESRDARMRAIEEAERQREITIQREIKNDLELLKRQRREKELQERLEYQNRVKEARAKEMAKREQIEARALQSTNQLLPSYQAANSTQHSYLTSGRHVDPAQVAASAELKYLTRRMASPSPPRQLPNQIFNRIKHEYAYEERWVAEREQRTLPLSPISQTANVHPYHSQSHTIGPATQTGNSRLDGHYEVRFRERVLDDAYNRAEMARLLRERRL